jgi:hypothetical protein
MMKSEHLLLHASLNAATANGWLVVSMKNDWKNIFLFESR